MRWHLAAISPHLYFSAGPAQHGRSRSHLPCTWVAARLDTCVNAPCARCSKLYGRQALIHALGPLCYLPRNARRLMQQFACMHGRCSFRLCLYMFPVTGLPPAAPRGDSCGLWIVVSCLGPVLRFPGVTGSRLDGQSHVCHIHGYRVLCMSCSCPCFLLDLGSGLGLVCKLKCLASKGCA